MKVVLVICLAVIHSLSALAQVNADSLWNVWEGSETPDSSRFAALRTLIWDGYMYSQPDSAYLLAELQLEEARRLNQAKWMADAVNTKGVSYKVRGELEQALTHFLEALEMRKEIGDLKAVASSMNNVGVIFDIQGEFDAARTWYQQSLAISRSIEDSTEIANTLINLGINSSDQGDYEQALLNYKEGLKMREAIGDKAGIAHATLNVADIYYKQGDHGNAIDWFSRARLLYEETQNLSGIAACVEYIGSLYKIQGEFEKAKKYYQESLELGKEMGAQGTVARSLHLLGTIERAMGDYQGALDHLRQALKIQEEMGYRGGMASTMNSMGTTLLKKQDHAQALAWFRKALALREEIGHQAGIAESLNGLSDTYQGMGNGSKAVQYARQAYQLATEIGNATQSILGARNLYLSYKLQGNSTQALKMNELYHQLDDSLKSEENQREIIRQEYKYNYEKQALADSLEFVRQQEVQQMEFERREAVKDAELGRQRIALLFATAAFLFIVILAVTIFRSKRRSEELLLNILPAETAKELKKNGRSEARLIQQVTVLFTDFKGFTSISERLSPQELVTDLNECFSAFDHIMERRGVEKIKTIGDAYMAAGGLPSPNQTHARDVVLAALEIRHFMEEYSRKRRERGQPYFEIRIGVHTGPVVAGIVGVKKFQYDIWGDTVNTASRIESSGKVGKVNISGSTYQLVQHLPGLSFSSRGKVQVKGKGELEMFYVSQKDTSQINAN